MAGTYHDWNPVGYNVDRSTKNKRMFRIPIRGLFVTCTESLFFIKHPKLYVITIPRVLVVYKKEKTLTWKGSPLLMVANSHPPCSLA
jgi:hypothetical protein